jgi:nucleoside-diphosphate-sugar epimerase
MRIVITGGNGFVGKNLIPKLVNADHDILQITTNPELSEKLYGNNIRIYHYKDSGSDLKKALVDFEPETVIHLASYLTAEDDTASMEKLLNANIIFLCSILNALKGTDLKWFINTGSFAEYFRGDGKLDPAYLYTATKTASRIFVDYYSKAYNFNYMTIAPYTIYGGIDTQKKIIDIIYDSLFSSEKINLTPGNQVLDFIHIDDVTDFYLACLAALKRMPSRISFQLGTGQGHTLKEIASMMEKQTGRKANIQWGGKSYRSRDVMYAVADISKQYHLLNWKPKISLEKGIMNYLNNKSLYEIRTEN